MAKKWLFDETRSVESNNHFWDNKPTYYVSKMKLLGNKAFIIQTKKQLWRKFSFLLSYAYGFCHVLKTEAILNVLNTVISDHIEGKDCFHTSANSCWLFPLFTLIGCEQICDSAKFTVSGIQNYYASKWLRIWSVNEPFE